MLGSWWCKRGAREPPIPRQRTGCDAKPCPSSPSLRLSKSSRSQPETASKNKWRTLAPCGTCWPGPGWVLYDSQGSMTDYFSGMKCPSKTSCSSHCVDAAHAPPSPSPMCQPDGHALEPAQGVQLNPNSTRDSFLDHSIEPSWSPGEVGALTDGPWDILAAAPQSSLTGLLLPHEPSDAQRITHSGALRDREKNPITRSR